MIVVAIILIIAAIAIPNLLRARIAANDSSAAAGERTIVNGEVTYITTTLALAMQPWPSSVALLRRAFLA